jgi:hypothetical protein
MVYNLFLLLFTYSPYRANVPYYTLAVFTMILTEISHIKIIFKILVQMLKYFRMNFI